MQTANTNPLPSRYRSQRRPQPPTGRGDDNTAVPPPIASPEDKLARSKSRYRRRPQDSPNVPAGSTPPLPASTSREALTQRSPPSARQETKRTNARDALQDSPPVLPITSRFATCAPTGELFPPPKPVEAVSPPRRDGPPTSSSIQAYTSDFDPQKAAGDARGGVFGMFKRKRAETMASKAQSEQERAAHLLEAEEFSAAPTALLGTDAPKSAVNAGDRQVLIECGKSRILLPVTPSTTPNDIVRSAETCLTERIDIKTAVVLESFAKVGVQRPLRRYEHIRDVLNSWDDDQQNNLILVEPQPGHSEPELSLAGVPKVKPKEQTWLLSYSQRPGKWDIRQITLKNDGQITSQKEHAKASDSVNVCHLSDFDIYTPNKDRIKRKIKPPGKHCFAIKSQQKSAMFESTENFVHFFSAQDSGVADRFYRAVHAWRSWYLVNVLGEGKAADGPKLTTMSALPAQTRDLAPRYKNRDSMASHYQLGTFTSLIDMEQFSQKLDHLAVVEEAPSSTIPPRTMPSHVESHRSPERKHVQERRPTVSTRLPKQILSEDEPLGHIARNPSVQQTRASLDRRRRESADFATNGLLGDVYLQKQREQAEKLEQSQQAFTNGPTLLRTLSEDDPPQNSGLARRDSVQRVRGASADIHRHVSKRDSYGRSAAPRDSVDSGHRPLTRDGSKPLVDLAIDYRNGPVYPRRGRGHQPTISSGGTLIESARSHNDTSNLTRVTSNPDTSDATTAIRHEVDSNDAFTGEGLLAGAQARSGWGGADRGRGVMDGSQVRGNKPMLHVREESTFVPGSLLNRVEMEQGPQGPVIDRMKWIEKIEKTGEGY